MRNNLELLKAIIVKDKVMLAVAADKASKVSQKASRQIEAEGKVQVESLHMTQLPMERQG